MAYTENRSRTSIFIPGPQELLHGVRKWASRQRQHREVAKLLKQEDWLLEDMGITRGDVHEALAFRGDASLHLRSLAAKRRFWSRQQDRI